MAVKGHFIFSAPGRGAFLGIDNFGRNVVSYFLSGMSHRSAYADTNEKKFAGLTGNQLKLLALFAMTCDHVGLQLLPNSSFCGSSGGWPRPSPI